MYTANRWKMVCWDWQWWNNGVHLLKHKLFNQIKFVIICIGSQNAVTQVCLSFNLFTTTFVPLTSHAIRSGKYFHRKWISCDYFINNVFFFCRISTVCLLNYKNLTMFEMNKFRWIDLNCKQYFCWIHNSF